MKYGFLAVLLLCMAVSCKNDKPKNEEGKATTEVEAEVSEQTVSTASQRPAEDLSGEVIILTEEEFIARITEIYNPKGFQYKGSTPCLVDFYTDWCGPCIRMSPDLVALAKEYQSKVIIYKINAEKAGNASSAFNIQAVPTLLFFKPNAAPVRVEGAMSKEDLKDVIETTLLSK